MNYLFAFFLIVISPFFLKAQKNNKAFAKSLETNSKLKAILDQKDKFKIQILYTPVINGKLIKTLSYNVSDKDYFYPASTVKLPAALLALEKLNTIDAIDRNTPMRVLSDFNDYPSVFYDSTSASLLPSIGHYIKKILLVSDNDAFNRLYDFLGPAYMNDKMHEKGFKNSKFKHRLSISLSAEINASKPTIAFGNIHPKPQLPIFANTDRMGVSSAEVNYVEQARVVSNLQEENLKSVLIGKGYMQNEEQVNSPMDFSAKNEFSLTDQHNLIKSLFFPDQVSNKMHFDLHQDQLDFVKKYMSMMPRESDYPQYKEEEYYDSYVKFFMYGDEKTRIPENIKIYNKVGQAYGFLIDNAFIEDKKNNVSFLLSAVVYCNEDGILNDDRYEYDQIGFPFLAELGRTIYQNQLEGN